MKKTKIAIGALMLIAIFGANAFAQEKTEAKKLKEISREAMKILPHPSLPAYYKNEDMEKLVTTIEDMKQEQEKSAAVKINHTGDFYLEDTLSANSETKVFKVLLTKHLENVRLMKKNMTWTEDGVKFNISLESPYIYIEVTQPENKNKQVHMSLIDYNLVTGLIGVASKELVLSYTINGKTFEKDLGISCFMPPLPPHSANISLDQTFQIKNTFIGILETDMKYAKSKKKGFYFQNRYFSISAVLQKDGNLRMSFSNQNPLVEIVSAKLIKEGENIYCVYTMKEGDNQKETFKEQIVKDGIVISKKFPAFRIKSLLPK